MISSSSWMEVVMIGIAQPFNDLQRDLVIGDTDTDCFLLALEKMGNVVVRIQDKGKRTGQVPAASPCKYGSGSVACNLKDG